jgi:hypothetical protein
LCGFVFYLFWKELSPGLFSAGGAGLSVNLVIFPSGFLFHQVEGFAEGCRGLSCFLSEKPCEV